MAMKQMPLDDGAMPSDSMGLRVKKAGLANQEFELAPPVVIDQEDQSFEEEQLTQQEKFELDKKLLKQQMKEQLGRKPAQATTTNAQVDQEEVKAGEAVLASSESDGGNTTDSQEDNRVGPDSEKSFDSQIKV